MALCVVLQSVPTLVNEVAGCSALLSLELQSLAQFQGLRALAGPKEEVNNFWQSFQPQKFKAITFTTGKKNGIYCACTFSIPETGQSSCGASLKDHSSKGDNGYYVVAPKMVMLLNPHPSLKISW